MMRARMIGFGNQSPLIGMRVILHNLIFQIFKVVEIDHFLRAVNFNFLNDALELVSEASERGD